MDDFCAALAFFLKTGRLRRCKFCCRSLLNVAEKTKVCNLVASSSFSASSLSFVSSIADSTGSSPSPFLFLVLVLLAKSGSDSAVLNWREVMRIMLSSSAKCPVSIIRSASSRTR